MDEPEIRIVNVKDLRPGPIQHESLPDELLEAIHAIYETLGPFLRMNLEQWELGFMRDTHPEQEVAVWCRIAWAWNLYHQQFCESEAVPRDEEEKIVGALIAISTGIHEAKDLSVPPTIGERLIACWRSPG